MRDADAVKELGPTVLRTILDQVALDDLRNAIASMGANNAAEVIAAEVIRLGQGKQLNERIEHRA